LRAAGHRTQTRSPCQTTSSPWQPHTLGCPTRHLHAYPSRRPRARGNRPHQGRIRTRGHRRARNDRFPSRAVPPHRCEARVACGRDRASHSARFAAKRGRSQVALCPRLPRSSPRCVPTRAASATTTWPRSASTTSAHREPAVGRIRCSRRHGPATRVLRATRVSPDVPTPIEPSTEAPAHCSRRHAEPNSCG